MRRADQLWPWQRLLAQQQQAWSASSNGAVVETRLAADLAKKRPISLR
ncbi:hypothetical protein ACU4GH_38640 [Bradyrhizobium betae]